MARTKPRKAPRKAPRRPPPRREPEPSDIAARVLPEPAWDGPGRDPGAVVAWVILALTVALVVWELHPELVFADTTPVSGDLGAHLQAVAYVRDHLLPHGRFTGWSPEHYAGYAIGTYYFAPGALLIALVGLLLPFVVAFKLVSALGPILLPVAAYAFGRLTGRSPLTAAAFAVVTLPLLLEPILFFGGGSIASTANGEFNYQLGLAIGLAALGVVWDGLATGRRRALAAVLIGVTLLVHVFPGLFVLAGAGVMALVQPNRARIRWLATTVVPAAALTGVWSVPFLLRAGMTSEYKFPRSEPIQSFLFPQSFALVLVFAVVGIGLAAMAVARRIDRSGAVLAVLAVLAAIAFVVVPRNRFGNQRLLVFWFLPLCLLAGITLAAIGRWIDDLRRRRARGRALSNPRLGAMLVPGVVLLLVPLLWPTPAGRGLLNAHESFGRLTEEDTRLSPFVRKQYGGYERSRLAPDYRRLIASLQRVGETAGCGRVHWEWTNTGAEQEIFMTMIPHWTDGCLTSTFGLFAEASATSPYAIVANARLSPEPYHWKAGLPYPPFDLDRGIAQLRVLGVRYYMATSARARAEADTHADLRRVTRVASTTGHPWSIYEVVGTRVVEPLSALPVVSPSLDAGWRAGALRWFQQATPASPVLAADGPDAWPRRSGTASAASPGRAATVSRVRLGRETVSFHVDRPGTPVLVRVSYFPNWQVRGARGPWRVTPNFMVVVPTENDVTLRYRSTGVERLAWIVSLLGLAGVALLVRRDGRSRAAPPPGV